MLVNQIAVFLENKTGRLDALVKSIARAGINMQSLTIADTNDFGIARIITDDNEKTLQVIKEAGFTGSCVDLIGVEVDNRPGTLAKVLEALSGEGVSVEYMYSYAESKDKNLILFKTADITAAQNALEKHNI